jgi:hypothetical protein
VGRIRAIPDPPILRMRMDCRTVGVVMIANDGETVIVQVVDCKCGREFCD